jgi:hypothetical protein
MKLFLRTSIWIVCCSLAWGFMDLPAQETKIEEDAEFVKARDLFWSGRYDEAEKKFRQYLIANPKHEPSKSFLQMIAQARKFNPSHIGLTRDRLAKIELEKVEFKNADWKDVFSYFQSKANPKENGKDPKNYINFINMLPSAYSGKVNLDLRNVSLLRAIEMATEQSGIRFVIDSWAVIFDLPEAKK